MFTCRHLTIEEIAHLKQIVAGEFALLSLKSLNKTAGGTVKHMTLIVSRVNTAGDARVQELESEIRGCREEVQALQTQVEDSAAHQVTVDLLLRLSPPVV